MGWCMSVAYGDGKNVGFYVKDERRGSIARNYREFSGGERFAIAVAVSLAISRVTGGASRIGCLFIDEGFGSLDSGKRERIVANAIEPLVEQNLREQVVVITHLEDMKDRFPARISIRHTGDGSIAATYPARTI